MNCMAAFQHKLNFTLGWTIAPHSIFAKLISQFYLNWKKKNRIELRPAREWMWFVYLKEEIHWSIKLVISITRSYSIALNMYPELPHKLYRCNLQLAIFATSSERPYRQQLRCSSMPFERRKKNCVFVVLVAMGQLHAKSHKRTVIYW